jgi:hypothetical protein
VPNEPEASRPTNVVRRRERAPDPPLVAGAHRWPDLPVSKPAKAPRRDADHLRRLMAEQERL